MSWSRMVITMRKMLNNTGFSDLSFYDWICHTELELASGEWLLRAHHRTNITRGEEITISYFENGIQCVAFPLRVSD
jgi:hypothetical protein